VSGIYDLWGVLIQQSDCVRRNVPQVGDQQQRFDFAVVMVSEPDFTQRHLARRGRLRFAWSLRGGRGEVSHPVALDTDRSTFSSQWTIGRARQRGRV
jgi:hypothetical protein